MRSSPFVLVLAVALLPYFAVSGSSTNTICSSFSETECNVGSQSVCHWCRHLGSCQNATENPNCECQHLNHTSCHTAAATCQWCPNLELCTIIGEKECHCYKFGSELGCRGFKPTPTCRWCPDQNVCINPKNNKNISDDICHCYNFDEFECRAAKPICLGQNPILIGVPNAKPYCADSALICNSPLTCEALNTIMSQSGMEGTCDAAGCEIREGSCGQHLSGCFSFFSESFISQPYLTFTCGFFKDIIVLFAIGAVGDWLMRRLKKKVIKMKFWINGWDKDRIRVDLDETVYVADRCYKENSDAQSRAMSFEEYCGKVVEKLFETDFSDEESGRVQDQLNRTIFDAVAFALYDNDLWIDFDDEERNNNNMNYGATDNIREKEANPQHSPRESETIPLQSQSTASSEKILLTPSSFANPAALRKIVEAAVAAKATRVVFYAFSHDLKTRIASTLNTFPSATQLVFYLTGLYILAGSTLFEVASTHDQSTSILSRVAGGVCTNINSTRNAVSTSAKAQFLFLSFGFRLVNSSSFATIHLVLVKVIIALQQYWSGEFHHLTLPQRLPLIGFYSKRSLHVLLFFYLIQVLPFSVLPWTYGWYLGAVCGLPLVFCLIALALDRVALKFTRIHLNQIDETSNRMHVTSESELGRTIGAEAPEMQVAPDPTNNFNDEQSQSTLARFFHQGGLERNDVTEVTTLSLENPIPSTLGRAFLIFLISVEVPVILLTAALQASFNYVCFLQYAVAFGVDSSSVFVTDFAARRMDCYVAVFDQDVSSVVATLSSALPFF